MLPGCPFHVTHRGNQKRVTFDSDESRLTYLSLLGRHARKFGMDVWSYCLMPNHVHLIVLGREAHSISRAVGNTHRAHSRIWNRRAQVTGHVWANRFFSTPLDDVHLWAAVRYVELNPVRANLVTSPTDYRWSSARGNAAVVVDPLLDPERPFPGHVARWSEWLALGLEEELAERIRSNTQTGRPTGNEIFRQRVLAQAAARRSG